MIYFVVSLESFVVRITSEINEKIGKNDKLFIKKCRYFMAAPGPSLSSVKVVLHCYIDGCFSL